MMTDIFKNFTNYQRTPPIKNPKDDFCFNKSYCYFVCYYHQIEIIPDVILLSYEQALNNNRYLKEHYPNTADKFWLFAHSGCGDEWFLNKNNHQVFYYDHDEGEYDLDVLQDMAVGFDDFVELILTIQTFENKLDIGDILEIKEYFNQTIYPKNPTFFDNYPYQILEI